MLVKAVLEPRPDLPRPVVGGVGNADGHGVVGGDVLEAAQVPPTRADTDRDLAVRSVSYPVAERSGGVFRNVKLADRRRIDLGSNKRRLLGRELARAEKARPVTG